MMSNAVRVWVSWAVSRWFWARSRSTLPLVATLKPDTDLRESASRYRPPASRAAVHSLMCE